MSVPTLKTGMKKTQYDNLVTSCEKCEFLENRLSRHMTRQHELWLLLETLKRHFEENQEIHTGVRKKCSELFQLQSAISDLQIFLFNEREENLRLAGENDSLRIEIFEERNLVTSLLEQVGMTRAKFAERLEKSQQIPEKKISPSSNKSERHEASEAMTKSALCLEIRSLKTQLENLRIIFRNEVDVLLKDREVVAEERITQSQHFDKEMKQLSEKLHKVEAVLCETVEKLLELESERDEERDHWLADRAMMERRLHDAQLLLLEVRSSENFIGNRERSRLKQLEDDLEQREKAIAHYQTQSKHFESEMKKWKEKSNILDLMLKENTRKCNAEISILRGRNDSLNRRRQLEASGFKTDIKILRAKLKEMEQSISKMRSERENHKAGTGEEHLRATSKQTLQRAKQLEKELGNLRIKVATLTNERSQWLLAPWT